MKEMRKGVWMKGISEDEGDVWIWKRWMWMKEMCVSERNKCRYDKIYECEWRK